MNELDRLAVEAARANRIAQTAADQVSDKQAEIEREYRNSIEALTRDLLDRWAGRDATRIERQGYLKVPIRIDRSSPRFRRQYVYRASRVSDNPAIPLLPFSGDVSSDGGVWPGLNLGANGRFYRVDHLFRARAHGWYDVFDESGKPERSHDGMLRVEDQWKAAAARKARYDDVAQVELAGLPTNAVLIKDAYGPNISNPNVGPSELTFSTERMTIEGFKSCAVTWHTDLILNHPCVARLGPSSRVFSSKTTRPNSTSSLVISFCSSSTWPRARFAARDPGPPRPVKPLGRHKDGVHKETPRLWVRQAEADAGSPVRTCAAAALTCRFT